MTYFLQTVGLAVVLGMSAGPVSAQEVYSADADRPGHVVDRPELLRVQATSLDDSDTPGVRLERPPVEREAEVDDRDAASSVPRIRHADQALAVFTDAQLGRTAGGPALASIGEPGEGTDVLADGRDHQRALARTIESYDGPLDYGRTPVPQEAPGYAEATDPVLAASSVIVAELTLEGVAPNPVRDRATVTFQAPIAARAVVTVYDVRGREVGVAFDGDVADGSVERVVLDLSRVATGTYVVVLDMAGQRTSQTFQVVR